MNAGMPWRDRLRRARVAEDRGAALVEFALILPILVLLLVGGGAYVAMEPEIVTDLLGPLGGESPMPPAQPPVAMKPPRPAPAPAVPASRLDASTLTDNANGAVLVPSSIDTEKGAFVVTAPAVGVKLAASYYYQWFSDAELTELALKRDDSCDYVVSVSTSIAEALPLLRRHGVRLHVDAAYGGFFVLLTTLRADEREAMGIPSSVERRRLKRAVG